MNKDKKILVIGATGHVGSQVVSILSDRGYSVRALVRSPSATIEGTDSHIDYAVGDLSNPASIKDALRGVQIVVNTANGIIPQKKQDSVQRINQAGANMLIETCEQQGVERFVQSSVPVHDVGDKIDEIKGKRSIEDRLGKLSMQSFIVRNPAFMDVWLVMCGFQQAEARSKHATTRRNFGFMKLWRRLVGDFVVKYGWFIAPGGAQHGSPMISTRDVAELLVAGVAYSGDDSIIIESGGPQYLTWQGISETIARRVGRKKLTVIPMPAWLAKLGRDFIKPFSPSAANTLSMVWFVAAYQPRWDSAPVLKGFNLPEQQSLQDYLDQHMTLTK